jgi:hypothetical protein
MAAAGSTRQHQRHRPTADKGEQVDEQEEDMISTRHIQATADRPSSSSRRGRFSDGLARSTNNTTPLRIGSFADGFPRRPDERLARAVGSFANGIARRPSPAAARRIGHFSDGLELAAVNHTAGRGPDSRHSTEEGRIAA